MYIEARYPSDHIPRLIHLLCPFLQVAASHPIERTIQEKTGMAIGRHTDDQYPFNGRIASLVFFRESFDDVPIKVSFAT